MTSTRTRMVGLAATLASIPLLLPAAAGATSSPANDSVGSSDDPWSYPPFNEDCAGELWYQSVNQPYSKALSASTPDLRLWGVEVGHGTITVTDAVTWDNRDGQEGLPDPELYESMSVEFYRDGVFLASTPLHTPDLPDDATYAWSTSTLGSVDLLADANEVYLVHSSRFMTTDGGENAFFPKAVCIQHTPFVPDPAVSLEYDCDTATVTYTNRGKGWSHFSSTINGTTDEFWLAAGVSRTDEIALVEDGKTSIKVTVLGDLVDGELIPDETILDEVITTDCEQPPVTTTPPTTTPPTTPPTVTVLPPTEVLAQVETAPQLAFTGDESVRNAGLGGALLAAGAAMLGLARRRRPTEA